MANIDDPKHAHYLPPLTAGAVIDATDKNLHKAIGMHVDGHLGFTFKNITRTATNPDGSVSDDITVTRTYHPSPK